MRQCKQNTNIHYYIHSTYTCIYVIHTNVIYIQKYIYQKNKRVGVLGGRDGGTKVLICIQISIYLYKSLFVYVFLCVCIVHVNIYKYMEKYFWNANIK